LKAWAILRLKTIHALLHAMEERSQATNTIRSVSKDGLKRKRSASYAGQHMRRWQGHIESLRID